MATTRSLLIATLVAAAAALTAAAVAGTSSADRATAPDTTFSTPATATASLPTARRPTTTPPASPAPAHHSPRHTTAPRSRFTLTVTMGGRTISTNVEPMSVSSGQPVDPPHATAEQWNTAAWIEQSTYPSTSAAGTTYVYGHACHHHICPFTNLKDAAVGNQVVITTTADTLTYRIDRIGLSPKSAQSLPSWASDSTMHNRVVLVTCAYEQGDTSTQNIVVVAHLS